MVNRRQIPLLLDFGREVRSKQMVLLSHVCDKPNNFTMCMSIELSQIVERERAERETGQ